MVVVVDDDRVVGCAVRTAPHPLLLSPMSDEAAAALGRAVAAADPALPGLTGTRRTTRALLAAIPAAPTPRVNLGEVVHVLDRLVEPAGVPGAAVRADASELHDLVRWHEQFAADAGLPAHDLAASVQQRLRTGALLWWEVDGERVSMAGHAPPLPAPGGAVGRVGPVFTPARFRRRGYAAAVTAAVVRRLLPTCSVVMLYTDAANPTSNGVYARLGFRPVAELEELSLTS